MKHCPKCGTSYLDDTLRYCLADGEPLDIEDLPTIIRTSVIQQDAETFVMQNDSHPTRLAPSKLTNPMTTAAKVMIAIALIAFVALVGLSLVGIGFYVYFGDERLPARSIATPTPTPAVIRRVEEDDAEDLRRQIAELQKQLDKQKDQNGDRYDDASDYTGEDKYATVDSPTDGFLALRSLASSTLGERLAKIPHGTRIYIGGCGPYINGKVSGRWCLTRYNGQFGWVFDAYLIYE